MIPEWLTQLLGPLLGAAAAWGAIRADIRNLHDKVGTAQRTGDKAHERIDTMLHHGDTGSHQPYRERAR